MGAVLSTAIMNSLDYPRDYTPNVIEFKGRLTMAFLEAAREPSIGDKVNLPIMHLWLVSAMEVNRCSG